MSNHFNGVFSVCGANFSKYCVYKKIQYRITCVFLYGKVASTFECLIHVVEQKYNNCLQNVLDTNVNTPVRYKYKSK